MRAGKPLLVSLSALLLALDLTLPASAREAGSASGELPLGNPNLSGTRDTQSVAQGVEYTRIERGQTSKMDFYTVDAAFESGRRAGAETGESVRMISTSPAGTLNSARVYSSACGSWTVLTAFMVQVSELFVTSMML